ncbi:MAG TPA: hypothetical protein VFQ65_01145 [Kofleriaceae bacterium]|nr:hypothetical protein [Kofleriaceae bacterium]
MSSNAQLQTDRVGQPDPRIDLVYVRPLGDFRAYESRLLEVAGRFGDRVRFTRTSAGELALLTCERAFSTKTVPNVVLVRDGAVIAQAVGELPVTALVRIVERAIGG